MASRLTAIIDRLVVARQIHEFSRRRNGPFVAVNCAASSKRCSRRSCSASRNAPRPACAGGAASSSTRTTANAVSRRGLGPVAVGTGEAAAGDSGSRRGTRRRARRASRRHPDRRGDQPGLCPSWSSEAGSARSVLPAGRRRDPRFRRCASGGRTSRAGAAIFSIATGRPAASPVDAAPPTRWSTTTGPATCANSSA